MSTRSGEGFVKERAKWVDAELARLTVERGLSAGQQKTMRSFLEKEFENVWETRDYRYGYDESPSQPGER